MRIWQSRSAAETREIGRRLSSELAPDGCLLLEGPLGAGKTVLVQGLAAGLGFDPAEVQSPTYTLVRVHEGPGGRLLHFDLYRLSPDEVVAEGFEELLAGPGVKAVEWAERLPFPVPRALRLELAAEAGEAGRTIRERTAEPARTSVPQGTTS